MFYQVLFLSSLAADPIQYSFESKHMLYWALHFSYQSQYDRMVEEKDAELDEKKKKEMKAVAHKKSLVWC